MGRKSHKASLNPCGNQLKIALQALTCQSLQVSREKTAINPSSPAFVRSAARTALSTVGWVRFICQMYFILKMIFPAYIKSDFCWERKETVVEKKIESLLPIVTVCGGCVTVREEFWVSDQYKGVVSDFILSENISVSFCGIRGHRVS